MRLAPVVAALALLVPDAAHADNATGITGNWVGSYDCAQGKTPLTLELKGEDDGLITGTFAFGSEASPPLGRYSLDGTLNNGILRLRPKAWINQPDGYVMVGLAGFLGFGEISPITGFSGQVTAEGCKGFVVRRAP